MRLQQEAVKTRRTKAVITPPLCFIQCVEATVTERRRSPINLCPPVTDMSPAHTHLTRHLDPRTADQHA